MTIALLIAVALFFSILLVARWRQAQRRERRNARKVRHLERETIWNELLSQKGSDLPGDATGIGQGAD